MSVVPINRATPEQISHYFGGRPVKRKVAVRTSLPPLVQLSVNRMFDGWSVQLPLITRASQVKGNRHAQRKAANLQIDTVLVTLQSQLRSIDRAAIRGITLVRISPKELDAHDNLPQAFKHVVDATCAWIVCGDDDINRHAIGRYDDQLIRTGRITCNYEQTTCEHDRRKQGIQIRFRLG
jgi:hypothetical protein